MSFLNAAESRVMRAGIVLGTLILAVIASRDGWSAIVAASLSPHSSGAGVMAFAAAAYLLFHRRSMLKGVGMGSLSALALATFAAAAYIWGYLQDIAILAHAGAIFFTLGMVSCVLHRSSLHALAPAAFTLLFAIPLPGIAYDVVSIPLQLIDARTVEAIGQAAGLPVTRTGTLIQINGVAVDIDRGCDGLRLVWPMLLAAYTAAVVGIASRWTRIAVCLLAIPVALVLNLVRLAITTYLYGYASQEIAALVHDILGWVMIVSAGFVPFLFLSAAARVSQTDASRMRLAPIWRRRVRFGAAVPLGAGTAALLLAAATMSFNVRSTEHSEGESLRESVAGLPYRVDQWVGEDRQVPEREREILAADALLQRVYHQMESDERLLVLMAYHRDGRRAAGHDAPSCYRVRGWQVATEVPSRWVLDGSHVEGTAYELFRGNSRMTVFEIFTHPGAFSPDGSEKSPGRTSRALLRVQFLVSGLHAQNPLVARTLERFLSPLFRQRQPAGSQQTARA